MEAYIVYLINKKHKTICDENLMKWTFYRVDHGD